METPQHLTWNQLEQISHSTASSLTETRELREEQGESSLTCRVEVLDILSCGPKNAYLVLCLMKKVIMSMYEHKNGIGVIFDSGVQLAK